MQSSLVTCLSKEGWPSRHMHACDRDGTTEELVRWPETHCSFHEKVPHLTPQHPRVMESMNRAPTVWLKREGEQGQPSLLPPTGLTS